MRLSGVLPVFGLVLAASTHGAVTRDIDYRAGVEWADSKDRLDVHMPDSAEPAPVLVYFHGGALMFGDKSLGDPVAERLVPLGIGVVSASYRLSPGVVHPAHVEDAAAALAWTVGNIGDFGGDPRRIYVAGHSAGAYLAALLTLDPGFLQPHGVPGDAIAGSVLISPFLYVEETAPERPKTVWGPDPEAWLEASVTPRLAGAKPPTLLLYADGDEAWRKSQIRRYVAALAAAGNAATAVELPRRDHRSLISDIGAPDDRIGDLVVAMVAAGDSP